MDKEIKRRGKAERETEEVRMEYIKLKQAGINSPSWCIDI